MTKLSYHVSNWNNQVIDSILKTQPEYIKVLDPNADILDILLDSLPHLRVIYRRVDADQSLGKGEAIKFAKKVLEDIDDAYYYIWAVEGLNEVIPETASNSTQRLYDLWQAEYYDFLKKETDVHVIGFNFATGNFPNPTDVSKMRENFPQTLERYKYLGFHEYDWPKMNRMAGNWLTLRYRRMRDAIGGKHKYIITECGLTQGVSGGEDVGWLADPKVLEKDYLDGLRWYSDELDKDDYILSAHLFKTGGGTSMWDTFESTIQLEKLYE